MEQTLTIFAAGISGVFLGMALIYLSILITSRIVDRLRQDSEEESS